VEGSGPLLVQGFTLARTAITIDTCETSATTRADGVDVLVKAGASLSMRGGTYSGHVQYEGVAPAEPSYGYGSITLDGVGTRDKVLIAATGKTQCRYSIRDCCLLNADNEVRARVDAAGTIGTTSRIPAK
jgi:hypothetical protein